MSGVYMAETAVAGAVAVLRGHLASELADIDTAKADGITTDKPTSAEIIEYARGPDLLMRNVLLEVFCDMSRQHPIIAAETDRSRITSENELTVRISIADRDTNTPSVLFKKMARTVAAVIELLTISHWTLDGVAEYSEWLSVRSRNLPGDQLVRQSDVIFNVRVRETSA